MTEQSAAAPQHQRPGAGTSPAASGTHTAGSAPDVAAAHARLRAANPLVQCITNTVVQPIAANALLAIGASPAMINHEADAAQFTRIADALNINFGTASSHNLLAADASITAAKETHTPWVLDPVSYGVIDYRTSRIKQALTWQPTAIRGNASEIAALAGMGAGARGVDSTDEVDAALPAAIELSHALGSIVAISGPVDAIVQVTRPHSADPATASGAAADSATASGTASSPAQVRVARVPGGSELMPLVVGTGCSLGAVTAAYLGAASDDPFGAVVAAHAHYSAAGLRAARTAAGPGSFAVAFIDALHTVTGADLAAVGTTCETTEVQA